MSKSGLVFPGSKPEAAKAPATVEMCGGFLRIGNTMVDPCEVSAVYPHPQAIGTHCVQLRNSPAGVGLSGIDITELQNAIIAGRAHAERDRISKAGCIPAGVET